MSHPFSLSRTDLLCACLVLGTVLGGGDTTVSKTDEDPCLMELIFSSGKTDSKLIKIYK